MRLERLDIEDYALIARGSIVFASGLTVCSGETGSGKTMLLGALDFVLGGRSSLDIVRTGSSRARVSLEFEPGAALRERLSAEGFELESDESAVLAREMSVAGKSSARINGRAATSAQLRAIGDAVVAMVGQHEQQHLLAASYQLESLDAFAGADVATLLERVASDHARVSELELMLRAERDDVGRAQAESAFARFALDEIAGVEPRAGEDAELRARRDYLANVERIASGLAQAHAALVDGEGAALDGIGSAAQAVTAIEHIGGLAELAAQLLALQSEAGDAAVAIARAIDATEAEPGELETVSERLDALEQLKRKYGGSLEAVLALRERYRELVDREETRDERLAFLERDGRAARERLAAGAKLLGDRRARAAVELERRVARELAALAMPAARLRVDLPPLPEIGPRGAERVEFALSANAGEPPRPLAKAASGGELSRVLLALVAVLAERRATTALVFDEIDAGIGGATARSVGARLGALAASGQVVCVTHLAQIAAWADAHYVLRKREGRATVIEIEALGAGGAVLEELARMLSGSSAGVALEHARTLLGEIRREKSGLISA